MSILRRVSQEPPFRLGAYALVRRFARSVHTINRWGAVDRPNYFAGVLAAAKQAAAEKVPEISAIEFGVAGGNGLVALQEYAETIERETRVKIRVFGFDTGEGLPELCNDYRDHPDTWRRSDYKMDVDKLKGRLSARTELRLGNIRDTVPVFVTEGHAPAGFISFDADLYSSTVDALRVLSLPGRTMLRRAFLYFDDVNYIFNHRFAGELLAIDEFNAANAHVKIDKWHGLKKDRVFPEDSWLDQMYIAHDIEAISKCALSRAPAKFLTLA